MVLFGNGAPGARNGRRAPLGALEAMLRKRTAATVGESSMSTARGDALASSRNVPDRAVENSVSCTRRTRNRKEIIICAPSTFAGGRARAKVNGGMRIRCATSIMAANPSRRPGAVSKIRTSLAAART